MVYCYYQIDKNDDVLEMGKKLIKDGEADHETYFLMGEILAFAKGKYDQAIPLLKESLNRLEDTEPYFDLGLCYLRKKMFHLGILYFEKYFLI